MSLGQGGVVCYACGGTYGRLIMGAFAQSCGGELVERANPALKPGISVVWGLMRGGHEVIEQAKQRGDPWVYMDHGYFRRGHTHGYYRATVGGYQKTAIEDRPADRWNALNIPFSEHHGQDVILAPPSPTVQAVFGPYWPPELNTGRKVLSSKKDGKPWFEKFKSAHMLITYNSIAAVEAVVRGVPVMTTGESAAQMFSSPGVESPVFAKDRQAWANSLAYGQFTLEEIGQGVAWKILFS